LWALQADQIMAPWDWRAARRAGGFDAANSRPSSPAYVYAEPGPSPSSGGKCGSKRYCRQMNSCQEAMYFLKQCGLTRLDGDGDGVPCESLC
jgi:hypothetical protein